MTKQRQLKSRIRERMTKTGESYLTARRHVLNSAPSTDYDHFGGVHPETAALANCFANRGVLNPLTGEPIGEAAILGIGGGLGGGYILWEFDEGDRRVVTTGFRNQWQYPQRWMAKVCDRLGIPAEVVETPGPTKAAAQLDDALGDGTPVVAAISAADIGYWHMPTDMSGWMGYPVVVYGRSDGGDYLVDDRGRAGLTVTAETLAAARGRISSYKNRLLVADPAATEVDADTFRAAVLDGIDDHIEHLSSKSSSFSIPAFAKWSKMVTADKPKGWPTVFADDRGLLGALVSTVEAIDEVGILGGNLRGLFADFCVEVGEWLDLDLSEAAEAYQVAAMKWADVAAVPMQIDSVAAVVEADRNRRAAVAAGDTGAAKAKEAADLSTELLAADSTGLSESDRIELFTRIGDRLADAVEGEKAALAALIEGRSSVR